MPTVLELTQMPGFKEVVSFVDNETALGDPQYIKIKKAFDFWQSLREHGLPSRSQIDPVALGADILPHVVLIDVIDNGKDYCWRLFGSRHEVEYGVNLKGKTLSEISKKDDVSVQFKILLDATINNGCARFFKISYSNSNDVTRTAVGAMMPLWSEGPTPSGLFGVADWIAPPVSS
jgi:hypothetical protein